MKQTAKQLSTMMEKACDLCGPIGHHNTAQTGYGDSFPDPVSKLKRLEISLREDIYRCPECDAFFFWEDHTQLFGSGNLDEETLTRLSEPNADLARKLLALPDDEAGALALVSPAFAGLESRVIELILMRLCYERPVEFRHILPALVDRMYQPNCSGIHSVLASYCFGKADRARAVLEIVAVDPREKTHGVEWLCKSVAKEIPSGT